MNNFDFLDNDRLKKQIEFLVEIDKMKNTESSDDGSDELIIKEGRGEIDMNNNTHKDVIYCSKENNNDFNNYFRLKKRNETNNILRNLLPIIILAKFAIFFYLFNALKIPRKKKFSREILKIKIKISNEEEKRFLNL